MCVCVCVCVCAVKVLTACPPGLVHPAVRMQGRVMPFTPGGPYTPTTPLPNPRGLYMGLLLLTSARTRSVLISTEYCSPRLHTHTHTHIPWKGTASARAGYETQRQCRGGLRSRGGKWTVIAAGLSTCVCVCVCVCVSEPYLIRPSESPSFTSHWRRKSLMCSSTYTGLGLCPFDHARTTNSQ